jgi:hypothetical protein
MSAYRVVNHGVDTVVLNAFYTGEDGHPIKRELEQALHVQLDEWKRASQGIHDEVPTLLVFNGATLHMQPNGAGQGQWPWMLKSKDLTLYISGGQWNGIASVRLSSEYLWGCSKLVGAMEAVQVLLDELFGEEVWLQLSLVDLCVDLAGWRDIDQLDRFENFITRARKRTSYGQAEWGHEGGVEEYSCGRQHTGFAFGKDKKGRSSLSCRIYDKTREIEQSGKAWVYDLWRARGWSEDDGTVWRVEVSFKRDVLHELYQEEADAWGVEDAYVLPDVLPLLWAYAVGQASGGPDGLPDGWLRCAVSNGDKNRSRWPTHPAWKEVQGAFTQSVTIPEQFGRIIRKRHEERSIEKGIEAVIGYLTSMAAWAGGELAEDGVDLSVVLHWLAMKGQEYLERVDRDFSAEIARKRVKLGLQVAGKL